MYLVVHLLCSACACTSCACTRPSVRTSDVWLGRKYSNSRNNLGGTKVVEIKKRVEWTFFNSCLWSMLLSHGLISYSSPGGCAPCFNEVFPALIISSTSNRLLAIMVLWQVYNRKNTTNKKSAKTVSTQLNRYYNHTLVYIPWIEKLSLYAIVVPDARVSRVNGFASFHI